ncbi:hypothetical protein QWY31_10270 [Cytophagales bacterium LB-30]|uniref:Uncharacterized protein n=1 Tax=Shiella aurantiaca TaxID=3058365 RepID=A0ABT8F686_9BACT|nr:hypothetical protein [Shiella aurantiaca]MDN4165889.1 hypothetical protein [Shiella aurantiaca]
MKPITLFLGLIIFSGLAASEAQAQKVSVQPDQQRVAEKKLQGYSVTLEAKKDKVEPVLLSYLKDKGRVENKKTYLHLREHSFGNLLAVPQSLYAQASSKGLQTVVFFGIDSSAIDPANWELARKELERYTYDFGITYYRDEVQKQINEAERATEYTSKNYQKLINEGNSLSKQLENAKAEKEKLEKALIANVALQEELANKQIINKAAQDSTYVDLEKMKTVLEMHKKKLGDIQ